MSDRELDYLVNYVTTNTGRGRVFAHNILCELYGICIEDEVGGLRYEVSGGDDELMRGLVDEMINNPRQSVSSASSACLKTAFESITLYPNPGKEYITIISEVENYHFELINVMGIVQKSIKLNKGSNTINTSSLQPGIYIYKAVIDGKVVSGKWIKL